MLYEKQTWKTGDVITAEKLNNIESGIKTLSNRGFEALTEENYIYFDDNVELEVQNGVGFINDIEELKGEDGFSNAHFLPSELEITFDGNTYIAPCIYDSHDLVYFYGATVTYGQDPIVDWSTYPFRIDCRYNPNGSFEQISFGANVDTSGPHTLRIAGKKDEEVLAISQTFKEAVKLTMPAAIEMRFDAVDGENTLINMKDNVPISFDTAISSNTQFFIDLFGRGEYHEAKRTRTHDNVRFDVLYVDDAYSAMRIYSFIIDNEGSMTHLNYDVSLSSGK